MRERRCVGGVGGGKVRGGRGVAWEMAVWCSLRALCSLSFSASAVMLAGSPVAARRKRDSCWCRCYCVGLLLGFESYICEARLGGGYLVG